MTLRNISTNNSSGGGEDSLTDSMKQLKSWIGLEEFNKLQKKNLKIQLWQFPHFE